MSVSDTSFRWWSAVRGLFVDGVLRVWWLCAYATVGVVAVAVLFLGNDQGADLLRLSAEPGRFWWNLCFALSAVVLALALWYSTRLLLAFDQVRLCVRECLAPHRKACMAECQPGDNGYAPRGTGAALWLMRGRIWWPRLYGVAIPALIGLAFLRVDSEHAVATTLLGLGYWVIAGLLWVFFIKRRAWLRLSPTGGLVEPLAAAARARMALILTGALLASAVLTWAFMHLPVAIPRFLGAPAIVLLALAGIAVIGGLVLTYLFLQRGWAPGTTLAVVVAVVVGLLVDNHWVQLMPEGPIPARLGATERLAHWREANPAPIVLDGRRPVIIVAAAGGGIRAAYWTAGLLAHLEATPGFRENLFAISAVSGGSVGAATYTAIRWQQRAGQADADTLGAVRTALKQDFLSPVLAGLLFPDLTQRFVPMTIPGADRQRFLELAFEHSLASAPDNPLSNAFLDLYADGNADHLPQLLLNTTLVDSGRRGVFSSIRLDGFNDTLDLIDVTDTAGAVSVGAGRVRLSAAAGASARFTYVSPAGSLLLPVTVAAVGNDDVVAGNPPGTVKVRLVDGGYFDNSGAATAVDLLNVIDREDIFPILILIRNDPTAEPVCQGRLSVPTPTRPEPAARNLLSELLSPIRALLHAREARGRLAEVDAAKRFERSHGVVIELPLAAVMAPPTSAERSTAGAPDDAGQLAEVRARLRQQPLEPPLGWSLSRKVSTLIDTTIDRESGGLQAEFAVLAAVLAGDPDRYRPCGAR